MYEFDILYYVIICGANRERLCFFFFFWPLHPVVATEEGKKILNIAYTYNMLYVTIQRECKAERYRERYTGKEWRDRGRRPIRVRLYVNLVVSGSR